MVRAGYEVTRAADGEEGRGLAREKLPDLILLDMLLPKLSGPDVLRALKLDAATASDSGGGDERPLLRKTPQGSRRTAHSPSWKNQNSPGIKPRTLLVKLESIKKRLAAAAAWK